MSARIVSPMKVRQFALEVARSQRAAAKFQRVSREFIEMIETAARAAIIRRVQSHPSKGVTLK